MANTSQRDMCVINCRALYYRVPVLLCSTNNHSTCRVELNYTQSTCTAGFTRVVENQPTTARNRIIAGTRPIINKKVTKSKFNNKN